MQKCCLYRAREDWLRIRNTNVRCHCFPGTNLTTQCISCNLKEKHLPRLLWLKIGPVLWGSEWLGNAAGDNPWCCTAMPSFLYTETIITHYLTLHSYCKAFPTISPQIVRLKETFFITPLLARYLVTERKKMWLYVVKSLLNSPTNEKSKRSTVFDWTSEDLQHC